MALTSIGKGDWLIMPTGAVTEVCKIHGEMRPVVSLRYLDNDGVMATGEFRMKRDFLLKHCKKVDVA